MRVDHTVDEEVAAFFARVRREQKRLDVLVNILTHQPVKHWNSFWKLPLAESRTFVDLWLWPHIVTCWHAAAMMSKRKTGLMVEIVEHETIGYHGQLFFDLMEVSLKRLTYALAQELASRGVAAVAIAPGFMRTEAILDGFGATEATWRDAALSNPKAKNYGFISSESPCFVGRAVAALAADPDVMRRSGGIFTSWSLADEYRFTDLDGSVPNMPQYMREHVPSLMSGRSPVAYEWSLRRRED